MLGHARLLPDRDGHTIELCNVARSWKSRSLRKPKARSNSDEESCNNTASNRTEQVETLSEQYHLRSQLIKTDTISISENLLLHSKSRAGLSKITAQTDNFVNSKVTLKRTESSGRKPRGRPRKENETGSFTIEVISDCDERSEAIQVSGIPSSPAKSRGRPKGESQSGQNRDATDRECASKIRKRRGRPPKIVDEMSFWPVLESQTEALEETSRYEISQPQDKSTRRPRKNSAKAGKKTEF